MGFELLKLSVAVFLGFALYVNGQTPDAPTPAPGGPALTRQLTGRRPHPLPPSGGGSGGDQPLNPLPAGAEAIIGSYIPGFSCDDRKYGYYADIANGCKVFHVCWPITDERDNIVNKHWIFFCGNLTFFNQRHLVCDRPENVDCPSSEKHFSVNDDFGKIPGTQ